MIITPCKHGLEDLVGKSPAGRTQGLHMSDIYGRYHETGKKRTKEDDAAFATAMPNYFEAGLTFEQMLEDKFKERMVPIARPGELTTPEGIIYSPDLFIFGEDVDLRLGEIKLTWMSNKGVPRGECSVDCFPKKFDKYFTQIMAYAYNVETPYARLIAFFINGDYAQHRQPELLAWDITFTARELRENWQKLIRVAKAEGML